MANIKWRRGKPFVYKSERVKAFDITDDNGIKTLNEQSKVKSIYLGTYENYRKKHPCGKFDTLVKSKTRLDWMSEYPDRLKTLHTIDEEVYREFERNRS